MSNAGVWPNFMDRNNIRNDGKACKHHTYGKVEASKPKASLSIYTIAIQNISDVAMEAQNSLRTTQNKNKIMLQQSQNMLG